MILRANDLMELCELAAKAANEASAYIQSQFNKQLTVSQKTGGDTLASQVVTEVDMNAQKIILDHLEPSLQKYDLGLLTEELSDDHSRLVKDYFWCVDPLDGTLPFSEGKTGYAVSIALINRLGDPVLGVANIPDLKDCYTSIKGSGVQLNGQVFEHVGNDTSAPIEVFMDRSFTNESYFQQVIDHLHTYASKLKTLLHYTDEFGGVRNAISVMNAENSCYFKFPKSSKGCGSIWDYAATRLFFEELGLIVSDASGNKLHLNNPKSTFMNEGGILYATDAELRSFIEKLKKIID